MKPKLILSNIFLLYCTLASFAQKSMPQNYAIDASGKLALNNKLDSIFSAFDNNRSPGVAVSIIQNEEVIANKNFGMASIELQVPFTHESVVKIGYSEAREFISIAAMIMEKDGLILLNDKVKKYFPKLPQWAESVTIWDLLNHRSGFVDEWATLLLMHGAMSNRFDKEQFLHLLYTQPEPEIQPGVGYMYCNSDFGLLRMILEKAAGKNLSDYLDQRIFKPLFMDNTRMQKNPLEIIPNRSNKYEIDGDGFRQDNVQKTSPGGNYFILTCADDLLKWSAAISDSGSEFHVAFNKLLQNVRTIPGKKNHYIIGYTIDTIEGHAVIIHEGVNGENYLCRIPSKGLTITTLGNLGNEGYSDQLNALIEYIVSEKKPPFIKPIFASKPIATAPSDLKNYEGKYRWENQVSWESNNELNKYSNVFVENGNLKIRFSANYEIALIPVGTDLFYFSESDFGAQIKFIKTKEKGGMKLTVEFDDGFPGESMVRESQAIWSPSTAELAKFSGKYHSNHLDYDWNLALNEEGKIILKRPTMPDTVLEPDGQNQFHYFPEKNPGAKFNQWLKFNTNSNGKITGFVVWSDRVMHHRFEKL